MHEVEFCAQVKSWLDTLFAQHPEWPFERAAIEQYGSGSNKRSDLRIYAKGLAQRPPPWRTAKKINCTRTQADTGICYPRDMIP